MADQGNATVRIRKVSRQNPTVQTAERAGHAAGHGLREVEINQRQLLLLPSHRLLFPSLIFTLDSLSFSDLEMATQNVDVREYDCLGAQLGFPSGRSKLKLFSWAIVWHSHYRSWTYVSTDSYRCIWVAN